MTEKELGKYSHVSSNSSMRALRGLVRVCHGGIAPDVVNSIMEEALRSMRRTYIEQIHPKLPQINPAKLIQSMREMRVYDGASQDDLATLESCNVLDVFEQDLKSKENYKDAILYLLNMYPFLEDYAKHHILPLPAD
ncbi:hypothetical protein ACROYT_G033314 [Oculina patagonica]